MVLFVALFFVVSAGFLSIFNPHAILDLRCETVATIIDPVSHKQECSDDRCTMSPPVIFIILKISP